MRDRGLVRVLAALLVAGSALPADLGGQAQKVLIRGMAIDSKEMVDSLSMPYWRALANASCPQVAWKPSYAPGMAFAKSTEPLLARLRRHAGAILPGPDGTLFSRRRVFDGPLYSIERVSIGTRLPNVTSTGFLATPHGLRGKSAPILLLHGSGATPAESFGWVFSDQYGSLKQFKNSAFPDAALELVEAGYTVFVPWFTDDNDNDEWPLAQWQSLARTGAALGAKTNGQGAYFLLVNQVAGGIDMLDRLPNIDMDKLAVIGWAEGAQIGAVTAALDPRIKAVVQLAAPLDRSALRKTVAGVFGGAAFTHIDCALGDYEMAALIAPRPLLFAYSKDDQSVSRFFGFISPRVVKEIRALYDGLRQPTRFAVQPDTTWGDVQIHRVRSWLDSAVAFESRPLPARRTRPRAPSSERYHNAFMDSTEVQRREWISTLGSCLAPTVKPNFSSIPGYLTSVEPLRRKLAATLRVPRFDSAATFRVVRRETVLRPAKYTLDYVELISSRSTIPVTGLLATPITNPGDQLPVVISMDANYGMAAPFGLNGLERNHYLNAYADQLASSGVVVFAPWIPGSFPQVATIPLRARDPDGPTSWSFTLPLFAAAVDFTRSLPSVDTTQIGVWGISYAAYNALFLGALDKRISTVVYSNPISTADVLFRNADGAGLAPWYGEMCSMIDPTMLYLIAPRRLVRENGARDTNGYEESPLETIEQIRRLYDRLGIPSQFQFLRHPGGHETIPRTIFRQ